MTGARLRRKQDAAKESANREKADVVSGAQHQAITLESRIESVDQAEAAAERVAARAGFDEGERHRIAMAVREITVNAVMHGNAYDRAKKVTIEFEISPGELVVSIRDQGAGFDLGRIADPLAPENLLRQSGRGIFLARAFMDQVDVKPDHHGTSVRLIKHRQAPPLQPPHAGRS
ncbi:MAG: ATP-binding protein [Acidobacteria bacterium]|nr:MAG: ATP-binding protein [Acidobacteriota bacterium]